MFTNLFALFNKCSCFDIFSNFERQDFLKFLQTILKCEISILQTKIEKAIFWNFEQIIKIARIFGKETKFENMNIYCNLCTIF